MCIFWPIRFYCQSKRHIPTLIHSTLELFFTVKIQHYSTKAGKFPTPRKKCWRSKCKQNQTSETSKSGQHTETIQIPLPIKTKNFFFTKKYAKGKKFLQLLVTRSLCWMRAASLLKAKKLPIGISASLDKEHTFYHISNILNTLKLFSSCYCSLLSSWQFKLL